MLKTFQTLLQPYLLQVTIHLRHSLLRAKGTSFGQIGTRKKTQHAHDYMYMYSHQTSVWGYQIKQKRLSYHNMFRNGGTAAWNRTRHLTQGILLIR